MENPFVTAKDVQKSLKQEKPLLSKLNILVHFKHAEDHMDTPEFYLNCVLGRGPKKLNFKCTQCSVCKKKNTAYQHQNLILL